MYLKMLSDAVAVAKGEKPDTQATECQVDVRIGAHIPEDYIESLPQRIDIYKKIASVENDQDALDITDELIDRFGDPPESVKGLIDVSLLRNKAASLGIKEISQRTDSLLFYPEVVDMEAASRLAANLKGRVMAPTQAQNPTLRSGCSRAKNRWTPCALRWTPCPRMRREPDRAEYSAIFNGLFAKFGV